MEGKKAQIAMEYLILTGFILVAVALIFSFSFINYNQNIRVAKTGEALAKLANAVDDVYTRGEGNTRFVKITWPDGMKKISIVHKCVEGRGVNQGTLSQCSNPDSDSYDFVEFSAIVLEVQLLSQDTTVMEGTRAKIFENLVIGGMDVTTPQGFNQYSGSTYIVKVSWTGTGLIKLERV